MPALEDCTSDLRRGLVAVCMWGGEVVVRVAEAGGAEGGVSVGCGGLFPLFREVRVSRVVLLRWGSSKAFELLCVWCWCWRRVSGPVRT